MYRSSPLRSTWNTGYIKVRTCVRVCTEAVHCVALGLWKQKNVKTLPRFSGRRQVFALQGCNVHCLTYCNHADHTKIYVSGTLAGITLLEAIHWNPIASQNPKMTIQGFPAAISTVFRWTHPLSATCFLHFQIKMPSVHGWPGWHTSLAAQR